MKFKSKYFMVILIICIIFSITAVSANDNQTDKLNHDPVSDNDIIKNTMNKSYNDFSEDIECCTDTFNIENNYVYSEKDDVAHLAFNQSNLVINGNNHVIDGSKIALGFVFINDRPNITINDLTFINCDSAIAATG